MIFTTGVIAVTQISIGGGEIHVIHDWETLAPAYMGRREKQRWTCMNWQLQMSNRHQNHCLHWPPEELTSVALDAFLSESLIGLLNLDIVARMINLGIYNKQYENGP